VVSISFAPFFFLNIPHVRGNSTPKGPTLTPALRFRSAVFVDSLAFSDFLLYRTVACRLFSLSFDQAPPCTGFLAASSPTIGYGIFHCSASSAGRIYRNLIEILPRRLVSFPFRHTTPFFLTTRYFLWHPTGVIATLFSMTLGSVQLFFSFPRPFSSSVWSPPTTIFTSPSIPAFRTLPPKLNRVWED